MKQTAVEWLQEQYNNCPKYEAVLTESDFEQAKQIEKQQIIDAHLCGLIYPLEFEASKQAEQYYNETFKNK